MEVTAGHRRSTHIVQNCGYLRASQLVEVEGDRQIHEFIQQILVE